MMAKGSSTSICGPSPALPLSIPSVEALWRPLQSSVGLLSRAWRWIRSQQVDRSSSRRLHVAATVALGEKRFVAVIQVDGLQFLIGGGATNVALLAQLPARDSFGELLNETMLVPKKQPVKRTRKQIARPLGEHTGEQA